MDDETLGVDQVGQTKTLAEFAKGKDVAAITVSIGGNDLRFGKVISDCLTRFLERKASCSEDLPKSVSELGSPGKPTEFTKDVSKNITNGLTNI